MHFPKTTLTCLLVAWMTGAASAQDLRGSWQTERYVLQDGTELSVDGLIFFTDEDWTVLFFVTEDGEPRRGAAEGGTYTLEGDALTFSHVYHLSAGEDVGGPEGAPLRMSVVAPEAAETEPCRVEIGSQEMEIFFPSGNRMVFRRR